MSVPCYIQDANLFAMFAYSIRVTFVLQSLHAVTEVVHRDWHQVQVNGNRMHDTSHIERKKAAGIKACCKHKQYFWLIKCDVVTNQQVASPVMVPNACVTTILWLSTTPLGLPVVPLV